MRSRSAAITALLLLLCAISFANPAVEHHVQRGDIDLVYETAGKGQPILLLAGGPGVTPYSVKPVQDYLSLKYQAVLIHQRGTGKSKLPTADAKHINLAAFISDVDAVREDLGAEKVVVVGHSWGGMLAMAYAGAHPERVSHLILMDSGGVNMSFSGVFQDNIHMHLTDADLKLREQSGKELNKGDALGSYHYLMSILPGYFYKREYAEEFMKTVKPNDFNPALQRLLSGFDVTKSITKYKGKVDIIQGRQDPIDRSTVALNMKYLPQANVHWIERAGHIPWLEEPADFQKAMRDSLG